MLLVPRGTLIHLGAELRALVRAGPSRPWTVRLSPAGILDEGHVRFFTRRGLLRWLRDAGFSVQRHEVTGLPLEVLTRSETLPRRLARIIDRFAVAARPTLFGYQFVVQCESTPEPSVVAPPSGQ